MDEKIPIIYTKQMKEDYLYYIKENFALIRKIFEEKEIHIPYDEDETSKRHKLFYQGRAKNFQIMTLIGINAEHILKIILLTKNYIIYRPVNKKFKKSFLKKVKKFEETNFENESQKQKAIDSIYNKAKQLNTDWKTIKFWKCVKLFKDSIKKDKDYFDSIKKLPLNIPKKRILVDGMFLETDPGPIYKYFGFKEIDTKNALDVIREMRNIYIHVAGAHDEQQGIIHYLYNFLLYLCVKEFKSFFIDEKYLSETKAKVEKLFPSIEKI